MILPPGMTLDILPIVIGAVILLYLAFADDEEGDWPGPNASC